MLTIDEAFAGGVCRCQHCGTIQTVPTAAKGNDGLVGGSITGQSLGGSKVMVPKQQSSGTGLDDLADIVASSGLAGSGLTSRRLSRTPATPGAGAAAQKPKLMPMIVGGAAMGVVVVAAIAYFATRGDATAGAGGDVVTAVDGDGGASAAAAVRGPAFAGVSLDGNNVIYVLDRGSGTREVFELMKLATLRSIGSLGNDRKFQVIFWDNTSDEMMFPETGPTYATAKKIEELRTFLDGAAAFGATDAGPALAKAYAQSPDTVVLATGKGPDLNDEFIAGVDAARKGANIRTHTFSLGEGGSDALKSIAEKTNAQYQHLTPRQLDAFTR
ncbi:MAG TPA: hypothetical protein VGN72_08115 [Tepidisphaeraceae bacterium]|nr:hypothetical protein [Tepidisphaeraceae bacterium]